MTGEELAEKMYRLLDENPNAPVLWGKLRNYFRMAATTSVSGNTQEFPKMLYRRANLLGNQDLNRIVNDRTEEAAALKEGWVHTPSPPVPGFPKVFVEANMRGDYRKIRIANPQELTLFKKVTNGASDWFGDNQNALGGRPVVLDDLVQQYKERQHVLLEQELERPTGNTTDTGAAAPNADGESAPGGAS